MALETWFRDGAPDRRGIATALSVLDPLESERARKVISAWDFYRPSPLRNLGAFAAHCGVGEIFAMDESRRLPLKSFKMLGAVYAAAQVVAQQSDGTLSAADAFDAGKRASAGVSLGHTRLVAASDGNHGRALAWAASKLGVPCSIYLPPGVSPGREQKIRDYGAETIRIAGSYDDAVRQAHRDAIANGWTIIQDTALPGFEHHCFDIMHGYTLVAHEAVQQLGGKSPSHVVVPAGVGGFAAATAAYFASHSGSKRPVIVIVEPRTANCVQASLRHGSPTVVGGDHATAMGGLACGEVSMIAWGILHDLADAAISIDDVEARKALQLATQLEPGIEIGETGIAGLAAVLALSQHADLRAKLGIDERSTLLAFITEGITDEESFSSFVAGNGRT